RLIPGALLNGLRSNDVFVDSPLARAPLDDLVGGAREISGDPLLVAVEIVADQSASFRIDVRVVGEIVLWTRLPGRAPHPRGAFGIAGKRASRRKGHEASAGRSLRKRTVRQTSEHRGYEDDVDTMDVSSLCIIHGRRSLGRILVVVAGGGAESSAEAHRRAGGARHCVG